MEIVGTIFNIALALCALALTSPMAATARALPPPGFSQVTDFGPNPTNIEMFVYVPPGVTYDRPAMVVALHYCGGTAQAFYQGTRYAALANQKKSFIVLYGNSPPTRYTKCWDVSSPETLEHDAGGDSLGIASAVRNAIANWNVDPRQVFVTGLSSGAMMTNVMAGAYPELFQAGAVFAGVPFGCFATLNGTFWSDECSQGNLIKTPQEWGDLVRNASPELPPSRPRMQLWHGTRDEILNYNNFGEQIKQWTNVFGLPDEPIEVKVNDPEPGYTHVTYGWERLEGYFIGGASHNIPIKESIALNWFGL